MSRSKDRQDKDDHFVQPDVVYRLYGMLLVMDRDRRVCVGTACADSSGNENAVQKRGRECRDQ